MRYDCKHQGEYYSTAVFPQENIRYVDFWYPPDYNLPTIKRLCKNKKITLLMARTTRDFAYSTDDAYDVILEGKHKKYDCSSYGPHAHTYCHWKILCGNTRIKFGNKKNYVANDFESFSAYSVFKGNSGYIVKDLSVDFWLELTKNF